MEARNSPHIWNVLNKITKFTKLLWFNVMLSDWNQCTICWFLFDRIYFWILYWTGSIDTSRPVHLGFSSFYSHVNMWRLEASLVNVVEGEGLGGVGAVLVHLHRCPVAPLRMWLSLRLLPPRCHNLWQGEGHDTGIGSDHCWLCFRWAAAAREKVLRGSGSNCQRHLLSFSCTWEDRENICFLFLWQSTT